MNHQILRNALLQIAFELSHLTFVQYSIKETCIVAVFSSYCGIVHTYKICFKNEL